MTFTNNIIQVSPFIQNKFTLNSFKIIYFVDFKVNTKMQNGNSNLKEMSPREKTVLLPVISQKPGLI